MGNTTPDLKYIDTELKYKFDELQTIQRKIASFGILRTMPIGSGKQCIFKSIDNATNSPLYAPPKAVNLPSIHLKHSSFDEEKERVKLGFALNADTMSKDVDVLQNLYILVCCQRAVNVQEQKENDEMKAIHEEVIAFKDCQMIKSIYHFYVNYEFGAGLAVAFKLKAKFMSPDKRQWNNPEGEWSLAQTCKIPKKVILVVFKIELNGKSASMSLNDNDVALTDFAAFKRTFLNWFGKELTENEQLVLKVSDEELSEKSKLIRYATDSFVIKGQIEESFVKPHSYRPQMIEEDELIPMAPGKDDVDDDDEDDMQIELDPPKQISTIATYAGKKKRVLLRNNEKKQLYEYTMDALQDQLVKKFKAKKLKLPFNITTDKGQAIQTDEDIATHLFLFDGELVVTK